MTNILYNGPHFTMEVPTEWVATANPRVQVVIYPPGFEDAIPPSYGVMIRYIGDPNRSSEDIAREILTEQQQENEALTVLTFEEAEYGGLAGFRIEAQWDNPDGTAVAQEQYITLIPGYVYVSILTYPPGVSPQITQMLQDIHRSFSFK